MITRRAIIIACVVGLELVIGALCSRWNPWTAGIVEKDGVLYEMPRVADPVGISTLYFEKKQFEKLPAADAADPRKHVLTWYMHAPEHTEPGKKYPLVMVLHGRPGRAYAAEYLVTKDILQDFPAFIFVPTAPVSHAWAVPDKKDTPYAEFIDRQSLPDAMEILKQVMQEYKVDSDRVYIVGCSEGGIGVFGATLRYPEVFAAAAAISGTWDIDDAPKMTKVPLWVKHGAKDPLLPASISRAMAESIRAHGGTARYTEISDMGHDCPSSRLYDRALWEWMFGQKKG